jgi:hypothetical protein
MVRLAGIGSALAARRCWRAFSPLVDALSSADGFAVHVRVGVWPAVKVAPRPSVVARMFLPSPAR